MQAQTQCGLVVLAWKVVRAFGIAGKEALCIHQFKAIAVDRASEEVCPVYGVAQVLQYRQFSFHEA